MLTKDFEFDLKEMSDQGSFEGYASAFGNVDSDGDVIEAGAFRRTLGEWRAKGKPIPVLWQHNPHEPVGVTESAVEDSRGLNVRGKFIMGITKAREAFEAAKAGVLGGLSIGFSIPSGGSEYDKRAGVRRIRDVNLWEYSFATFPSNSDAVLTGVKSAEISALLSEWREISAILKASAQPSLSARAATDEWSDIRRLADQLRAEVRKFRGGALR